MKKYKVEVSKGIEKVIIIRKTNSLEKLKEDLHNEGYGILSITQIDDIVFEGKKFFIDIRTHSGKIKTSTVFGKDILKLYIKLKYELDYDLLYIYETKNESQENKEKIINQLKEKYEIYKEVNKKELDKKKEQEKGRKKEEKVEIFQMGKEISDIQKSISFVIEKITKTLEDEKFKKIIVGNKRILLKEINNKIIRIKKSTNITKLKQIGELALKKIGEIEVEYIEEKKKQGIKKISLERLNETNELLKKLGSRKNFKERDKDFSYKLNNIFKDILNKIPEIGTKNKGLDKTSQLFVDTRYVIDKYKRKLEEVEKEIKKNFLIFLFPSEKNHDKRIQLSFRKKIIKNNIIILNYRLQNKPLSLRKIKKSYNKFDSLILDLRDVIKEPLYLLVIFFSIGFLTIYLLYSFKLLENLSTFNITGLFYFIIIYLFYLILDSSVGIMTLIINFVIFVFLFIFFLINF